MKYLLLVIAALLPLTVLGACRNIPPVVKEEGPSVLRASTAIGVQWALSRAGASTEEALRVKNYLIDASLLLNTGQPPVTVLDQIASLLNQKITNSTVRAIIQAGILTLKTKVTIPVDGVVSPEVKMWVNAVLEGAILGCAAYTPGQAPLGTVPEVHDDQISFR
jgi:hypothetical protein